MHFGATLRLLRLDSGLSLRDLARRLEVSSAYLSRVENGIDAVPTPARLEAMARELGLPAATLMEISHRVSPLVVDYVEQVPEAGSLFLDIAHRGLDSQQLAELRRMLDAHFPAKHASATGLPAPDPQWHLARLVTPERVVLGLRCSNVSDVLDVAASRLLDTPGRTDATHALAELQAREREFPSALGQGMAVPCLYLHGAPPAAAVLILDEPVPYATPDGLPLRAVIVIAGPREATERRQVIAQLARLTGRGLAERLRQAGTPEAVVHCLHQ